MAAPRQEAGGAAPEGAPIRVAVIEDDRRVRESLGDILSGAISVIYYFGSAPGTQH